jgi:O-Antigen ligase
MQFTRQIIHRRIYILMLMAIVATLPLSEYVLSMAEIFMAANYLLEGKYKEKWKNLISKKFALINLSLFVILIIGLIYTTDYEYAFKDIKIKLPLLFFPVIISTSEKLNKKELFAVFSVFILALLVSCGINVFTATGIRGMSRFVSHIRFGLLIDIGIFAIIYALLKYRLYKKSYSILLYFIASFFVAYLVFTGNFTGIIVFGLSIFIFLIYFFFKAQKILTKLSLMLSVLIFSFLFLHPIVKNYKLLYLKNNEINFQQLEEHTKNGNSYLHDTINLITENGYYIRQYICETELEAEWNKQSIITYSTKDSATKFNNAVLIRYMTSKNLRKDEEGMSKMTNEDVAAVEKGITNYRFLTMNAFEKRIYKILWEFQEYKYLGSANGHSVIQRFIYVDVAWQIIKSNYLFGVGTGDVKLVFQEMYVNMDTGLKEENQHRAHNQFLTTWVSYGIIGLLLFIFVLVYPFFFKNKDVSFLYIAFFIIIVLSMLTEDTLETQTGVSIFAFFNMFLFYNTEKNESKNS